MEKFGNFIALIGILLIIGNLTGIFRTFPFAGFLTMMVGSYIARSGRKR